MKRLKNIVLICLVSFIFSGCSIPIDIKGGGGQGFFLKSEDGGKTWKTKSEVIGGKRVIMDNILSMAINPFNSSIVYVGTENDGIFISNNGAESWKKLENSLKKVYSICPSIREKGIIYVSGKVNQKGKIYRVSEEKNEWKEIYSEPSQGSEITAMTIDEDVEEEVIYVGTSDGMIFKTINAGETWQNLYDADGKISDIEVKGNKMLILIYGEDILMSKNNGRSFENIEFTDENSSDIGNPFSMAVSFGKTDEVYIGTDRGLFFGRGIGGKLIRVNTLSVSDKYTTRSVSIDPYDSNRVVYSVFQGLYSSYDKGKSWAIFDTERGGGVSNIIFDRNNSGVVYATIRNFK